MNNNNDEIKIPELVCEGCKNRDRIIQNFAEHIDRQNELIEALTKEMVKFSEKELELAA